MSKKAVAVDGFEISCSDSTLTYSVIRTGVPSMKVKFGGKGVCKDGFGVQAVGVTNSGGFVVPNPVPLTFNATSSKAKVDGTAPLRVDDQTSTTTATGINPSGVTAPITFSLKISGAGQDKVTCA